MLLLHVPRKVTCYSRRPDERWCKSEKIHSSRRGMRDTLVALKG